MRTLNSQHARPRDVVNTTYTDVGSADIAGAHICRPCRLDGRVPAPNTHGRACRLSSVLFSKRELFPLNNVYIVLNISEIQQISTKFCVCLFPATAREFLIHFVE